MSNEANKVWLAERVHEVNASIEQIKAGVAPLAYLQIGWRPPEGGWSIAQVVEHLIISEQSYLQPMQRLLAQTPTHTPSGEWRPSLIGGFLTRSVSPESERKLPAPRMYRPAPEPRANVVDDYLAIRHELIALLQRADAWDLRRTKISSPVVSFIRMNLGDAFMTIIKHAQRHLRQIERIKAQPQFPGPGPGPQVR